MLKQASMAAGVVLLLCMVFPTSAASQALNVGAIEGVVQDPDGSGLPGVTVTLTSPAIMGTRVEVTAGSGSYRFLRLPAGEYEMMFSLAGFSTLVRSGIIVELAFTATISPTLELGSVEETITVIGASPTVDIKASSQQTILTSEFIATIPQARNIFDMAKMIPGMATGTPDVGGSRSVFYGSTSIHGNASNDRAYYNEGMRVGVSFGGGDAPRSYGSTGSFEEVNFQYSGLPAEVATGGLTINMVTKSGGNTFHGHSYFTFGNDSLQSSNLTKELEDRGVETTSGMRKVYDVDGGVGGPISRDNVWFFGSARVWAMDQLLANTVALDGNQASNFYRMNEMIAKITWQVGAHQFSAKYNKEGSTRPYRRQGATFVMDEAAANNRLRYSDFFVVKWTGLGRDWITEAGFAFARSSAARDFRPETEAGAKAMYDSATETAWNAPYPGLMKFDSPVRYNLDFSVTRLSDWNGTHEFKAGIQYRFKNYRDQFDDEGHGDIQLRFDDGVPESVRLYNGPIDFKAHLTNIGIYAQDAWTFNRVTINAGVRFHYWNIDFPETSAPAGTWVGARHYEAKPNVIQFKNVVPRFGVAIDLFGDGRTALKASASKYMGTEGVNSAEQVNPMFMTTSNCSWDDLNGDGDATPDEMFFCTGFRGGLATTLDPNLRRPYNVEITVGIDRELFPNWSLNATYYHRVVRDQRSRLNRALPSESYTPVDVTYHNTLTGQDQTVTIFNADPDLYGIQDLFLTNDERMDQEYNGLEFVLRRRFAQSFSLMMSYTYNRESGLTMTGNTQTTADFNDPNRFIYSAAVASQPHQFKTAGNYLLPLGINLSGFIQYYTGGDATPQYRISRSVVPDLTQSSITVRTGPRASLRRQDVFLVDLRISKSFELGRGIRVEPFLDGYNLLNANNVLGSTTRLGSSYGTVSRTINPRIVKIGFKVDF